MTSEKPRQAAEISSPARAASRSRAAIALAGLGLMLLLFYTGWMGRREAVRQARVEDIAEIRDLLRERVKADERPAKPAGTALPEKGVLVATLQRLLGEFDARYGSGKLPDGESIEVRLARGVLANAEGRYSDALAAVTEADEGAGGRSSRRMGALALRAEALCGMGKWTEALPRYEELARLMPADPVFQARLQTAARGAGKPVPGGPEESLSQGNQLALEGKFDRAIQAYTRGLEAPEMNASSAEAARPLGGLLHQNKGSVLLIADKPEAALQEFDSALRLLAKLQEQSTNGASKEALAICRRSKGHALMAQQKGEAAAEEYRQALALEQEHAHGLSESSRAFLLMAAQSDLGNAWVAQGKPVAALQEYDKALGFADKTAGPEAEELIALLQNNRGTIYWARKQVSQAIDEFNKAATTFEKLAQAREANQRAGAGEPRTNALQVNFTLAIGPAEKGLNVLTRTRLVEGGLGLEPQILLAATLKNRGFARASERQFAAGLADVERAVLLFEKLITEEGEKDLMPQLLRVLTPLAWMYATMPDDQLRNGAKAERFARQACELTDWKNLAALEALAAAAAENGKFKEAIQNQEKALDLAPAPQKGEVTEKLNLYKADKPYRLPEQAQPSRN